MRARNVFQKNNGPPRTCCSGTSTVKKENQPWLRTFQARKTPASMPKAAARCAQERPRRPAAKPAPGQLQLATQAVGCNMPRRIERAGQMTGQVPAAWPSPKGRQSEAQEERIDRRQVHPPGWRRRVCPYPGSGKNSPWQPGWRAAGRAEPFTQHLCHPSGGLAIEGCLPNKQIGGLGRSINWLSRQNGEQQEKRSAAACSDPGRNLNCRCGGCAQSGR